MSCNLGVIGAGVVGLTSALELQKEFRNAKITILAEKFQENTTSFVAAGLFRPSTSFRGPTEDITRKWIQDAYYYWNDMLVNNEAAENGIIELSGYMFSNMSQNIVRNHYLEGLLPIYRLATEDELQLCPGNWKYGSFFKTLLVECEKLLPWATNQFLAAGGSIVSKKIVSFTDIANDYDVVINCSGFGAKQLCHDNKLVPIRGQVLKVYAPWVKHFYYGDFDTYIIPGCETVTLGGCRQFESYNTDLCKYDEMAIRERCESLLPCLKRASFVTQRVGLRPHRDPVRVESEILPIQKGRVKVVHNYGHGGYGVTTAPGTAKHAVQLVRELLTGNCKL